MLNRDQIDSLVVAIKARDLARAQVYGHTPSDVAISEYVPTIPKLREIARIVGASTYELQDFQNIEAVDYAGVHFFCTNGKVK